MKHLKNTAHLFLWMLIGSLIGIVISTFFSELYSLLNELMPTVFPSYDLSSNDKFFDTLYTSLWFVSLFVTLFVSVYLSLRYDNEKFERIITKTDGLYKIPTFLPTYICIYGKFDVLSSVVIGSLFTIPFFFVPMQFIKNEGFLANLAEPYKLMGECFGYTLAPIVMILMIAFCYALSIPFALKYYRARWFSAFSEV